MIQDSSSPNIENSSDSRNVFAGVQAVLNLAARVRRNVENQFKDKAVELYSPGLARTEKEINILTNRLALDAAETLKNNLKVMLDNKIYGQFVAQYYSNVEQSFIVPFGGFRLGLAESIRTGY